MEKLKKIKTSSAPFLEKAYLTAFMIVVVYRFFITTLFTEQLEKLFHNLIAMEQITPVFLEIMSVILFVIVAARYLLAPKYEFRRYLLALAVLLCAVWIDHMHSNTYLIVYILLLLGAKDISFYRILRPYFAMEICFGIVTIIGSQIGLVENLVRNASSHQAGAAFGFIYPTDFAAHVFFLVLICWFLRNEKITYPESGAAALLGGLLYILARARCSSAMMILTAGLMFVWTYKERRNIELFKKKFLMTVLLWVPVFCAAVIHLFSILYSPDRAILAKADELLSNRLSLAKRAIDIYGFHLWGADIRMTGFGGSTGFIEKYFYIDSSYMQYSLIYGVAAMGLILFLLFLAGCRAYERENLLLLLILALASIHGIIEQHLLGIEYFPFLLTIFADMDQEDSEKAHFLKGKKWRQETSLP